jgi:hypothetical protein
MPDERNLDPIEQLYEAVKRHVALLYRSNTFWLCLLWMAWEFGKNIDPAWLANHVNVKTWMPPVLAALGIMVKVMQNIHDQQT